MTEGAVEIRMARASTAKFKAAGILTLSELMIARTFELLIS